MSHNTTIQELERLKEELLERAKQVDKTINTLRSISMSSDWTFSNDTTHKESKNQISGYEKFDYKTTFRNKVWFVIKKEDRFIHSREIADIFNKLEPGEKDVIRKVSGALSYLRQNNRITKTTVGKSNINTFWGISNWLDDNGKPKDGHNYNEEFVVKAGSDINEI